MNILSFVAGPEDYKTVGGIAYIDRLAGSICLRHAENNVTLVVVGKPPLAVSITQNKIREKSSPGFFQGFRVMDFPSLGKNGFSFHFFAALPALVRSHPDFITLHSIYTIPVVVGYLIARINHIPYAIWPHGVFSPYQRSVRRVKKWFFDQLFTRRILQNAAAVVFTAAGEREEFRELGLHIHSVVIPHGIDLTEFTGQQPSNQFRQKYFENYAGTIILFLSRVNSKKGLDILIPALNALRKKGVDFRAAIVGAGDPPSYKDEVKTWIGINDLTGRVVMTGALQGEDKLAAFSSADIFVLPSRSENFGYAIFEALASGLPVVITNCVNYAREIKEHKAGVCVNFNVEEISSGIQLLLENPTLRQEFSRNGREFVRNFSWSNTGDKINIMIHTILEHTPFPTDLLPEEL